MRAVDKIRSHDVVLGRSGTASRCRSGLRRTQGGHCTGRLGATGRCNSPGELKTKRRPPFTDLVELQRLQTPTTIRFIVRLNTGHEGPAPIRWSHPPAPLAQFATVSAPLLDGSPSEAKRRRRDPPPSRGSKCRTGHAVAASPKKSLDLSTVQEAWCRAAA